VLITHELGAVRRICTHAALLDEGRITEAGEVADLVADPGSELGQLIAPLPTVLAAVGCDTNPEEAAA